MKVIASVAPPGLVERRRRMGVDRRDEMWMGVLHMNPLPNRDHQELVMALAFWLKTHWGRPGGNKVHIERNVAKPGGWPEDYRGPDLVLLTPDRFEPDKNEFIEGPPTAVIEIRSPDDESYDKLTFYAELGVPEVWIVDRDTKQPEIFVLDQPSRQYEKHAVNIDGWLASGFSDIRLRAARGPKLAVEMAGARTSYAELPDD
jgi:Uma2 family endonuclease